MKGLTFNAKRQPEWAEINNSPLTERQVEIKVVMSGICGTDLAVLRGKEDAPSGIIRGHEAVGTIIALGSSVTGLYIGQRVVIDPNQYCGDCPACRSGATHLCQGADGRGLAIAGVNRHGTFAARFRCHARFVYPLPDTLSWEAGVLIEPLACVWNVVHRAGLMAGEQVLLLGSGPMSLVAQLLLRQLGIATLATECNAGRRDVARRLGLACCAPEALPAEPTFSAVIDTVGNQLELASRQLRRGGRIVLFGFDDGYRYAFPAKQFLVNAWSIIGCGEYNQDFNQAISLAQSLPDLSSLVTHKFNLDDYAHAFELLSQNSHDCIKAVLVS